ncbi:unnamed protein product [Closterium sp. Yama58-4]|nr:unnamed protein product [Closterium sp. Yama58-4]
MAPRKYSRKGKEKATDDDDESPQEHPYITWMREQQASGKDKGRIRREACNPTPERPDPSPGPSSAPSMAAGPSSSRMVENDDSSSYKSLSPTDSDTDMADSSSDGESQPTDKRGRGKSRLRRKKKKHKRSLWTMDEMTALAAARWTAIPRPSTSFASTAGENQEGVAGDNVQNPRATPRGQPRRNAAPPPMMYEAVQFANQVG